MSEDIRKTDTDNKILSFHIDEEDMQDPKMDRFVRESLIREADELEEELNSKPELAGIEAPEGLFEEIVSKLKESGVWEEDEAEAEQKPEAPADADTVYAQLSEEDQRALALGRELVKKQETRMKNGLRRRKILKIFGIIAASFVLVFGISMTSDANRRLVKRMWDGLMIDLGFKISTNYVGDEETVRSKSKEELEAMEAIRGETGAPIIEFCYLPEGMEYQGYELMNDLEAVFFYSYQDKIFYVTMTDIENEGSYYYSYDGDAAFREKVTNKVGTEAEIWEVNLNLEEETYVAEIEYEGWRYVLNGMISLEEIKRIAENVLFL